MPGDASRFVPLMRQADRASIRPRATPVAVRPIRSEVAFIGPGCWGHGGTEAWHLSLLPRLQALGVRVGGYGVLTLEDGPIPDALRAAGVALHTGLPTIRALVAGAKLVVIWGNLDLPTILTDTHPPVIAVAHGDANNQWTVSSMTEALPYAAQYVAISGPSMEAIPPSRRGTARTIINAVDPSRLVPSADRDTLRARLGWSRPTLLLVSRLSAEKAPTMAVRALAHLPGWRLAVAGHGADRGNMDRAADALGVADRIDWLGVRGDIGDLLTAADCMIAPSPSEGCQLAAAEALWCGLPIASCPVGILSDGRHGTIVPTTATPQEWAGSILRASADRRQSQADQEWARVQFDPDRQAAEWLDLIRHYVPAPVSTVPFEPGRIAQWRACPHLQRTTSCGCATCVGGPLDGRKVTFADCLPCLQGRGS